MGSSASPLPCVAAYLLRPRDPKKAALLRAKLVAFQRAQGVPAAVYEEAPKDHRRRPKLRCLIDRAHRGEVCRVCVIAMRHIAPTRSRVAQLVIRLAVPVVSVNGLRLDPADRVVRWIARERTEHGRSIKRGLARMRPREPSPETQRAIEKARALSESGMSQRQIAEHLTEAGHRTRRGTAISHKQVGRWIRLSINR